MIFFFFLSQHSVTTPFNKIISLYRVSNGFFPLPVRYFGFGSCTAGLGDPMITIIIRRFLGRNITSDIIKHRRRLGGLAQAIGWRLTIAASDMSSRV